MAISFLRSGTATKPTEYTGGSHVAVVIRIGASKPGDLVIRSSCKLVFCLFLGLATAAFPAGPPANPCLRIPQRVLEILDDDLVGRTTRKDHPEDYLVTKLTEENLLEARNALEDEILELYIQHHDLDPSFRRPQDLARALAHRLDIPVREAEKLILNYDLENQVDYTTDLGRRIYARARQDVFRRQNAERIQFYEDSLTQLSVPEMAQVLRLRNPGMTAMDVRKELFLFDMSIEEAWNRNGLLDRARDLHAQGMPIPEIARNLGVGEQSLRDIFHFKGIEHQGTKWELEEQNYLRAHYDTTSLYELSRVLQRSEAAIAGQAKELGLTDLRPLDKRDPQIEGYDGIKVNGRFARDILERFLWENVDVSNADLGRLLYSTPETIRYWRYKLGTHTPRLTPAHTNRMPRGPAPEATTRHAAQRELIARELEIFETTGTVIPNVAMTTLLGVDSGRYLGNGAHSPDKPEGKRRVFNSYGHRLVALDAAVESRVAEVSRQIGVLSASASPLSPPDQAKLADLSARLSRLRAFSPWTFGTRATDPYYPAVAGLYSKSREAEKARLVEATYRLAIEAGKWDSSRDAITAVGRSENQAFGYAEYAPGKEKAHQQVFESAAEFMKLRAEYSERRLAELGALATPTPEQRMELEVLREIGTAPPIARRGRRGGAPGEVSTLEHREARSKPWRDRLPTTKKTIVDNLIAYIETTGELPDKELGVAVLGYDIRKICGSYQYAPNSGKPESYFRVYDSAEEFRTAWNGAREARIKELESKPRSPSEEEALRRLKAVSPGKSEDGLPARH